MFCNYIIYHNKPVSGKVIADQLRIFFSNNSCYSLQYYGQEQNKQIIFNQSIQIIRRLCDQVEQKQKCYKINHLLVAPKPFALELQLLVIIFGIFCSLYAYYILNLIKQHSFQKKSEQEFENQQSQSLEISQQQSNEVQQYEP
ncbi:hypothetical protein ABPG72_007933 [Tetrahymena utriculariae]